MQNLFARKTNSCYDNGMVKAGSYERKPFHIESEIQKVKKEKQNETIIQTADVFVV